MSEIRFYHLHSQTTAQALPALLSKALEVGKRIVVRTGSAEETEFLNDFLWTYKPESFLPHGSKKDGHAALQPVWLTESEENPNEADTLICTGGAIESPEKFALCCEMIDGRNAEAVQAARRNWKSYKDAGHSVTYWQQNEKGGWEQKA